MIHPSPVPHMSRRGVLTGAAAALLGAAAPAALAQPNWPSRPLKIVLGYAAGGAGDAVARLMAQKYSEALGQPVIVENKPGANSTIAAAAAAKAPADGYTLYMGSSTDLTVAPTVMAEQIAYNVERDFTPLGGLVTLPNMLVVPANSPFNSVGDLVAHAKANPGKLSFASFGGMTTSYLAAELLKNQAGIQMTHVPFKGSSLALVDVLAGRIDLFFDTLSSSAPYVKEGRLKALAVTSAARFQLLPDIPTMQEQGFPDFVFGGSVGMLVASATPAPITRRLQAETAKIVSMPDVRARFTELGMVPLSMGPKEYGDFIKFETARAARLIKDNKLAFQ